jgi:hypothetical protein
LAGFASMDSLGQLDQERQEGNSKDAREGWDRRTDADRGQGVYWHRILLAKPGIPRRLARQGPFQRPLIQWALERWAFAPIVATSCIDLHCTAIVSKTWQFVTAPHFLQ